MTVAAVSTSNATIKSSASKSLAGDFDNFLKLLTTQLQRQDPLSPMDATTFTSQLVEFASVEQAIQTNSRLGEVRDLLQRSSSAGALGLLGKDVEAASDQVALTATGPASIHYRLPERAKSVSVAVLDDQGRPVHEAKGGTGSGDNVVSWNGLDTAGRRVPAGTYHVEIKAIDARGKSMTVEQLIHGRVSQVMPQSGQPKLLVDGVELPMDALTSIRLSA